MLSRMSPSLPGWARAEQILARVQATPPGFVRTYGDLSPGAPRLAGAVLHACEDPEIPWHRIVRADGSLAKGERQRRLLEAEGVPFRGSRVEMRVARMPVAEDLPTLPSRSRRADAWSGR
jgi:methylated-DNA-protein-cysteine methyltransferase related protein